MAWFPTSGVRLLCTVLEDVKHAEMVNHFSLRARTRHGAVVGQNGVERGEVDFAAAVLVLNVDQVVDLLLGEVLAQSAKHSPEIVRRDVARTVETRGETGG